VVVILAHGVARLANLGPGIGAIRSDLLPIEVMFALVVPLAFARTAGRFTTAEVRPRAWWLRWSEGRGRTVTIGAVVLAVVVCGVYADMVDFGTPAVAEVVQGRTAHDYLRGFAVSWATLDRVHPHAVVADTILAYPLSISTVPDGMYPYDTTALDLGMFVPDARFAAGRPGPGYAPVFPTGVLRPARTEAGPSVSLDPVTITGTVVRRTGAGVVCVSAGAAPAVVALPVGPESFGQIVSLGRRVSYQPFLHLDVASATGAPATVAGVATVRRGLQWIGLPSVAPIRAVFVTLPRRSTTCLRSASLGYVAT